MIKALRFAFSTERPSVAWSCFFYDENNICVGGANMPVGEVDVYVDVPSSASYLGVLYNPNHPYEVYQAA